MKANGSYRAVGIASSSEDAAKRLAPLGMSGSYHRGQEICAQGHADDSLYRIVSGAARRCVLRADGRRQIVDLLLPGDYFGVAPGLEYSDAVEAIVGGTVAVAYPRRRVEALADQDSELARELRRLAVEALARMQIQLLIVGRVTALEKVGSFLLEIANRLSKEQADRVVLPVSRYDIADYLSVSVETVSRALSDLKRRGLIELSGPRKVRIIDRNTLEESDRITHVAHPAATASRASSVQWPSGPTLC
jgi:CRP/FNR family transcriptional regulator, nitrogen fixation regulation protein